MTNNGDGFVERAKKHWLFWIVSICVACIAATYYVVKELVVEPRNFVIQDRDKKIDELKAENKTLKDDLEKIKNKPMLDCLTKENIEMNYVKREDYVQVQRRLTDVSSERNDLMSRLKESEEQSATVLKPTWIISGMVMRIFNDQVLLRVKSTHSNLKTAIVELHIPGETSMQEFIVPFGKRQIFVFKKMSYFLDVLDIDDEKAQIAISRMLP